MCGRMIGLTLFFFCSYRAIWSLDPSMPECIIDYEKIERPFIHVTAKSPDDFYEIFNEHERFVSPLTVQISKGNFTTQAKRGVGFINVPETGTYAIYVQINVEYIVQSERSLYNFKVTKISRLEPSHVVEESTVASRYLSSTIVGPVLCANLTSLVKNDLLSIQLDSNIVLRYNEGNFPIQLISYLVSPET